MKPLHRILPLVVIAAALGLGACNKEEAPRERTAATASPKVDTRATAEHGADEHGHAGPAAKAPPLSAGPEGVNAVQHEMLLLNDAMVAVFTLIIANELDGIPAKIHSVHDARDLTHAAIADGRYKPPKRSEDVAGFEKLDGSGSLSERACG
ncbi:MAG: hypothetical protein KC543_05130 [Myxococcales bacterium]|nr:hypothetical protein [Myxococcales bacterium]